MSRSTIIISRGVGAFEIRKKKNHQRFRNVAECLVQAKLTPHCKTEMWIFIWNTYFFNLDIFLEQIFV